MATDRRPIDLSTVKSTGTFRPAEKDEWRIWYDQEGNPQPQAVQERLNAIIGFGSTALLERVGDKVKKSPHFHRDTYTINHQKKKLQREFEVYQRLPSPHPRLITMYGFSSASDDDPDRGLLYEYMPKGNLQAYLESDKEISVSQRLQWCTEATEGVALLHAHGVIHADLRPENMLLDDNLGIRIIDFTGAIDDKPPFTLENSRYFLPRSWEGMACSVQTDLFALGSSIYHIMTRKFPYEDLFDVEVDARFARKEFPPVDGIPCGDVIRGCWMCQFDSAQDVLDAIARCYC